MELFISTSGVVLGGGVRTVDSFVSSSGSLLELFNSSSANSSKDVEATASSISTEARSNSGSG
jgi:hypothetical protein